DAPMAVAGAVEAVACDGDPVPIYLDPALQRAEPLEARRHILPPAGRVAGAGGQAGAVEDLPLGVAPVEIVGDAPLIVFEQETPLAQALDDRRLDRAAMHVHAVGAQRPEGADGTVLALIDDDRIGLGGVQTGIEAAAGY